LIIIIISSFEFIYNDDWKKEIDRYRENKNWSKRGTTKRRKNMKGNNFLIIFLPVIIIINA
jgi:hypothetical protein